MMIKNCHQFSNLFRPTEKKVKKKKSNISIMHISFGFGLKQSVLLLTTKCQSVYPFAYKNIYIYLLHTPTSYIKETSIRRLHVHLQDVFSRVFAHL